MDPSEGVGLTLQAFNLIGDLTVYEKVALPPTYRGMAGSERRERVQAALERARVGRPLILLDDARRAHVESGATQEPAEAGFDVAGLS